jgi:hypothetical protein
MALGAPNKTWPSGPHKPGDLNPRCKVPCRWSPSSSNSTLRVPINRARWGGRNHRGKRFISVNTPQHQRSQRVEAGVGKQWPAGKSGAVCVADFDDSDVDPADHRGGANESTRYRRAGRSPAGRLPAHTHALSPNPEARQVQAREERQHPADSTADGTTGEPKGHFVRTQPLIPALPCG